MEKRFFLKSGLFAYGMPLFVVGTTLLVEFLTEEDVTEGLHPSIADGW